ncbi:MAG TPA: DUF433 domain-containing protein [Longimicrobiaceae bacterium]
MSNLRPPSLRGDRVAHTRPRTTSEAPVFAGTRVPIQALVEHLESGRALHEFLERFPTVRPAHVTAWLLQRAV